MELKEYGRIIISIIFFGTIITGCGRKKFNESRLCREFYSLNKGKNFKELYDVSIGTGRVISVYDKESKQYKLVFKTIALYNPRSKGYVTIPVFNKNAAWSEKASVWESCDTEVKFFLMERFGVKDKGLLLKTYINYIDSVLECYYSIVTPKWYPNKNIMVEGNPTLRRSIRFTMNMRNKVCECFYVDDESLLPEYWSTFFNGTDRLGPNWFFKIHDTEND